MRGVTVKDRDAVFSWCFIADVMQPFSIAPRWPREISRNLWVTACVWSRELMKYSVSVIRVPCLVRSPWIIPTCCAPGQSRSIDSDMVLVRVYPEMLVSLQYRVVMATGSYSIQCVIGLSGSFLSVPRSTRPRKCRPRPRHAPRKPRPRWLRPTTYAGFPLGLAPSF